MKRKEVLTTGEVARICHVAPRTVSKWFDTGRLNGYRIPGSRDRRIPLGQLVRFMRTHGMPLKELEGDVVRVLVVDPDGVAAACLDEAAEAGPYEVRAAANDFEAGVVAGSFRPHVILVDAVSEAVHAAEILKNVRANPELSGTRLVAIAGPLTQGQRAGLLHKGFDQVLSRPYELSDLLATIGRAVDRIA